ncbi:uridine kinase family protein [Nonomuraea aurantiaca]|uniref:uridine kinase family protein n=1 Tax=Nonomuraea aurantiaca TaxID=2878562 RepID=UPI001CD97E40|nr:AAA family ATPase [Nonomuraea aurantiaca]MCA2220331.1 AAA family ATPase [Nonomuraea aurantiaca]
MESPARRIQALDPSCGPVRLVAVDGPAGSGKTTYAGELAAELGCQVVHSDDFPVPWDEGPGGWFDALDTQVLRPLQRGLPGAFRRYDWVRGEYTDLITVPAAPVLIIEGVGTARRSAAHLLAFTIWVEAPEEVRLRRVIERDGPELEPRWRVWFATEQEWFDADDTRGRADLVRTTAGG